ncbi:MAG: type II toxin-antitoxin system HicA family toxin [Thermodesulfobacteriota bacterium]|nr:type II toxin-antitoxin system HicA family toxin [Thermodesulfobacteriota bacterium]
MTPKPPSLSGREFIKVLKKLGYEKISQKGSHIKLKNYQTGSVIIVPDHKELDRWTLKTILKQAEITEDIIKKYL